MADPLAFDTRIKLLIYGRIAETGIAPGSTEVAEAVGRSAKDVEAAFRSLCEQRLLVLEPGTTGAIRMAPPFSGVETPFLVKVRDTKYYANCIWDALGIPAALHQDGVIETADAQTGTPLTVEVRAGNVIPQPFAAHFAVPAARWWDDIIYT